MNTKYLMILVFLSVLSLPLVAQNEDAIKDSLYIQEVEDRLTPDKVLHAEPLFIDLIRDLGARKGEKEWNIGMGLTDKLRFDSYEALIEYEWAPVDRLGFEIEMPFTFYAPLHGSATDAVPAHKTSSIKLATQWSFFVNEDIATSMALGYINEFEFADIKHFAKPVLRGNTYNPFFVIARRWGSNFHSLIYTGPMFEKDLVTKHLHTVYHINTSFHYMISGTRNFVGVEFNESFAKDDMDLTIRPQMRVGITENLLIGISAGIPVNRENERLSSFLRVIWEPGHHKK